MKKQLGFLVLLTICLNIYSRETFEKTFGSIAVDQGIIVEQIDDSTLVIMGGTDNYGNASFSDKGMFLATINSHGDTLWTNCYPGILRSGIKTSDSGFLLVGYLDLYSLYAVKTDSSGNPLWESHFGTSYSGARGAVETDNHEYILCGYINHDDEQSADVYLARLDPSGDTLWTKTYGTTKTESARVIIPTRDSNYIIAAWSEAMVWLLKIDGNGDILWDRIIETETAETCYDIHETPDSGFVVTGAGAGGAFLIKTNKEGELLWRKNYAGTGMGRSVDVTCDGGYILSSYSGEFGDSDGDILLLKTDENGDILWTRVFGGLHYDNPSRVIQAADSSFYVIGQTQSYGAGSTDIYLIKTDQMGTVDSTINELDHEINYSKPSGKNTCDGAITIEVRGGKPPYSYYIDNLAATDTITGLCDETYSIAIYDQYGNEIHERVSLLIEKIDSVVILPENPTNTDTILLDIYSKMKWSGVEPAVYINEQDIRVDLTYIESGYLDSIQPVTARVQLGQPAPGDYDVSVFLKFRYCNFELECDSLTYDQYQFLLHIAEPVALSESIPRNGFLIYPNPVTDNTAVYFNPNHKGDHTILIYNSRGQLIESISTGNDQQNMGRYFQHSGIYYVIIFNENAISGTVKLIRN